MKGQPLVYVVVLVYNGRKWLDACLKSVLATGYPELRVLAVDNASTDGSAGYIAEAFPGVELIRLDRNMGTGEGNNIGARRALKNGAAHVMLLNQDTVVERDWIPELMKLAESDGSMGMLVPVQYDYEQRHRFSPTVKKFLDSGHVLRREEDYVVMDKIIGAGMLLTRPFMEKVGLFDPIYFMYCEENDLVRRGYYHGFKTVFAMKSRIYHFDHLDKSGRSKSRDLFERNQLLEVLKDPRGPLVRNVFRYYLNLIGNEVRPQGVRRGGKRLLRYLWVQKGCLVMLPKVVLKRYKEKRFPCYLRTAGTG